MSHFDPTIALQIASLAALGVGLGSVMTTTILLWRRCSDVAETLTIILHLRTEAENSLHRLLRFEADVRRKMNISREAESAERDPNSGIDASAPWR